MPARNILAPMSDKSLIKRHSEGVTHNTIGSVISTYLIQGVPTMTAVASALLAYFQNGVPIAAVILIGACVFFLLSFAWYFLTRRRILANEAREESSTDLETTQPPTALIESEVAKAKETLTTQHQSKIELLQRDHEERVRGYERGFDDLKRKYDALQSQLEDWRKYDWLVSIAVTQSQDIHQYVKLSRIERGDIELNGPVPYVKFGIYVANNSLLDVTIELKSGYILFKDTKLILPIDVISEGVTHIRYQTERPLVIEQRLTREEANYIASFEGNEDSAFYFDRLILTIKGGNRHPPVSQKRLDINKGVTLQNKPLTFHP
jgi:hypothetical protein